MCHEQACPARGVRATPRGSRFRQHASPGEADCAVSDALQPYQVVMPKLGLTMTQAQIIAWHKQEGERVEKGEMLFTLESDKAVLDIEAPAGGLLHILVAAGQTVPVLTPIALLTSALRPAAGQGALRSAQSAVCASDPVAEIPPHGPPATPKARTLARQKGLALDGIRGSGPRGMIVAADLAGPEARRLKATPVARKMAGDAGLDLAGVSGSGPGGRITRDDVERTLGAAQAGVATPLVGLRAIIAERLTAGWRERPQVTLTTEADATNLVSARQQILAELGEKVSYDAFIVLLVARALREQPHINARLTAAGVERLPQINIGVAVDTERGLLVPVVHDADEKDLLEIQRTLAALAERAVAGRSLPDDLTGGTFTITNLGMYEIDAFTPIVNPPESAILGVGRVVARPVGLDGQIVLRNMMALSLSFDHRLIDGAPAARFLQRVKQLIERPFAALLPKWR